MMKKTDMYIYIIRALYAIGRGVLMHAQCYANKSIDKPEQDNNSSMK